MSQCEIILSRLEETPNRWVSMKSLAYAADCFAVNSRVADLRKRGLDIRNKTKQVDGKTYSYYKLVKPEHQLELL